jgi:DNA-binding protein
MIKTGINTVAVFKIMMLIIKEKRPRVIQIRGRNIKRRIGFINKLRKEIIRANKINSIKVP